MKKFTVLTLLLVASISSFAQKEYSPEFLIPYNNNGKWGWCDTTGKVLIEPQFLEVGFFYRSAYNENEFEAYAKTELGRNRYNSVSGILVPVNYLIETEITHSGDNRNATKRWFLVRSENNKLGIFETTQKKLVVGTDWDDAITDSEFENISYLKKNPEKTYFSYNRSTGLLTKTDFDSIFQRQDPDEQNDYYFSYNWFFKHKNGAISKLVNGKHVELTAYQKRMLFEDEKEELGSNVNAAPDFYFDRETKTFDSKSKIKDSATCLIGHVQISATTSRNITYFRIIRENGKIGVYDDKGILILPFIYDKLILQNNNTQALLFSGTKIGLKFFTGSRLLIEPKYDSISYLQTLEFDSNRTFKLFQVISGTEKGLVGENGAEYFHFD
jgi:hypothetical protein